MYKVDGLTQLVVRLEDLRESENKSTLRTVCEWNAKPSEE